MSPTSRTTDTYQVLWRLVAVLALLFVFLVGIHGMSGGFKMLGKDVLQSFFQATENPFAGLVVGILATTLVQSSSVTTSMIVALVAAPDNPLPVANAVPMIMGANIGTTVTNTIVALAHMARPEEFKRAFSVATCHDFFNVMSVVVLLPIEITTGFLSKLAGLVAGQLGDVGGIEYHSPLKDALKVGAQPVEHLAVSLFSGKVGQASVVLVFSSLLIIASLTLLVKVLRQVMKTRVEAYVTKALAGPALVSMIVGMIVTVMVQSSSITTSLLVPLAGAGVLSLQAAFPITLGANVGTTVTALLAALAVSGENASAGVQIALVHFFFNVIGILIIFPVPRIRQIPLGAAEWLAATGARSRKWAIVYVIGLFYGLPALLVVVAQAMN